MARIVDAYDEAVEQFEESEARLRVLLNRGDAPILALANAAAALVDSAQWLDTLDRQGV